MSPKTDTALRRGFDAGNYAAAYETDCYDTAIAGLSMNRSAEYEAAFTLGFFSSCELSEMSDPDAFEAAYALVAPRMIELGIAVEREEEEEEEEDDGDCPVVDGYHTSTSYGVMPSLEAYERAFDARCPSGRFSFGNDPYVGTDTLTCSQVWRELQAQFATWEAGEHAAHCPGDGECRGEGCPSEDAGSWCSAVLGVLGFEWI